MWHITRHRHQHTFNTTTRRVISNKIQKVATFKHQTRLHQTSQHRPICRKISRVYSWKNKDQILQKEFCSPQVSQTIWATSRHPFLCIIFWSIQPMPPSKRSLWWVVDGMRKKVQIQTTDRHWKKQIDDITDRQTKNRQPDKHEKHADNHDM